MFIGKWEYRKSILQNYSAQYSARYAKSDILLCSHYEVNDPYTCTTLATLVVYCPYFLNDAFTNPCTCTNNLVTICEALTVKMVELWPYK